MSSGPLSAPDIGADRQDLSSLGANQLCGLLEAVGIPIDQNQGRARSGERHCGGSTVAHGFAGCLAGPHHDGNPLFELFHTTPPFLLVGLCSRHRGQFPGERLNHALGEGPDLVGFGPHGWSSS